MQIHDKYQNYQQQKLNTFHEAKIGLGQKFKKKNDDSPKKRQLLPKIKQVGMLRKK